MASTSSVVMSATTVLLFGAIFGSAESIFSSWPARSTDSKETPDQSRIFQSLENFELRVAVPPHFCAALVSRIRPG
jgi:hypothetical protein